MDFTKKIVALGLFFCTIISFIAISLVEVSFSKATNQDMIVDALQNLSLIISFFLVVYWFFWQLDESNGGGGSKTRADLIDKFASIPIGNQYSLSIRCLSMDLMGSYGLMIFIFQVMIASKNIVGINLITGTPLFYWFCVFIASSFFVINTLRHLKKKA